MLDVLNPDSALRDLKDILPEALAGTLSDVNALKTKNTQEPTSTEIRNAWLRNLHKSFDARFKRKGVAVFGGRPGSEFKPAIPAWSRWEFLHDIAVVEYEDIAAPYSNRSVAIVRRAIWQVECEMALDASEVLEDMSKLVVGRSRHKLMIVGMTKQKDKAPWLRTCQDGMRSVDGERFLAMVRSYAPKADKRFWLKQPKGKIFIELYRIVTEHDPQRLFAVTTESQLICPPW